MTAKRLRILYLSNAFPPGISGRFPSLNPAGHILETRMIESLAAECDVASLGLLGEEIYGKLEPRDESPGLPHELLLWDRPPGWWHRWRAWLSIRRHYQQLVASNRRPDLVLAYNLHPVFTHFARWLRRQPDHPKLVLVFADSSKLGQKISLARRLRYSLKPMQTLDDKAISYFDGCVAFGLGTKKYFDSIHLPWLWMPAAPNFEYDPPAAGPAPGPIRFGYFGALAEHAAVLPLVDGFLQAEVPGSLHLCGFGKLSDQLRNLAARNSKIKFDGLLSPTACLDWAQQVDILINPRLTGWGLENSFPSKIFSYGLTGKAILTTRTGGVDAVLGADGLYLETEGFAESLQAQLRASAAMARTELMRRGSAIRNRMLKEYTWTQQAKRMVEFFGKLV